MIQLFFVFVLLAVGSITAAPQFVDFSNGGIGVNFGGYTARAGLGGLLTGNAADGGLSASAGTPFGQRAAAGIGGSVNGGSTGGGAYAGAQANPAVGASAVLSGSTGLNQSGFLGAEAHNNGKTVQRTLIKDSSIPVVPTNVDKVTTIQKVKPPKKYVPEQQQPSISSRFAEDEPQVNNNIPNPPPNVHRNDYPVVTKEIAYNPINFLNIPIGILKVIQDSLQPIGYSKQVSVQTQG